MRAWSALIREALDNGTPNVHAYRRAGVASAVAALVSGARATVTGIGRQIDASAERYGIKRMDRLVGNPRLEPDRQAFYRYLCRSLIRHSRPVIHVDWSPLTADLKHNMLAASVSVGRRAIPIYVESHPLRDLGSRHVERQFLRALGTLLPAGCRPIVVADAGFCVPFCREVETMGWDYLVRLRSRTQIFTSERSDWVRATSLHATASLRPRDLGSCLVARSQLMPTRVVLARRPPRGRVKRTRAGRRSLWSNSVKHAKSAREPWVLHTSLREIAPQRIVKLYGLRMGIEEAFRDSKNLRCGGGLSCTLTRHKSRLDVLTMLDALASYFAWLIGVGADGDGQARLYQANSLRTRRVLSYIYLGRRFALGPPPGDARRWMATALSALQQKVNNLQAVS